MTQPLLNVQDLTVSFETGEGAVLAVDGVNFTLNRGEVLGLVGESGSGKSVTAKSIMHLNAGNTRYGPASRMTLQGDSDVEIMELRSEAAKRVVRGDRVSMIFQEPMASFAPAVSIGKQMVEQLRLHRGLSRAKAKEVAVQMLARVGISDAAKRFDQYSFELSGGMRQRAMIAMALSTRPELLIADEPTTALDVTIQAQVLDLIEELTRETGMGVLFITHDLGVIAETADKVAVMYLGKIVEYGPVRDVILRPAHPYTRGLLDALPKLHDLDAPLQPVPGDIPSPLERPEGCVFHTRCAFARKGLCDVHVPQMTSPRADHEVACHLSKEIGDYAHDHL
jgi:oligopeptide/dipeptide ABC transporter ATP-binding protein